MLKFTTGVCKRTIICVLIYMVSLNSKSYPPTMLKSSLKWVVGIVVVVVGGGGGVVQLGLGLSWTLK